MARASEPIQFHYILTVELQGNGYGGRKAHLKNLLPLPEDITEGDMYLAVVDHAFRTMHIVKNTQFCTLFYRCVPNERS